MKILVTGAAGFIGAALCKILAEQGETVFGLDNLNEYYDVGLKLARLENLKHLPNFSFTKIDLCQKSALHQFIKDHKPKRIVHLAAQAGVRYSLTHPEAYIDANISAFLNILEACRHYPVEHLVFASSSSVYGANGKVPFSAHEIADHPVSLYGATKRANELMAHSYSHLFSIPMTGLRFFTVYGPWGRPDMALFLFTKAILAGQPIEVFNHGEHRRDFTYIDDIVDGVCRILDKPARSNVNWSSHEPDPASSTAPFHIYNIGGHAPIWLNDMIDALESALGKKAKKLLVDRQPGDVLETCAEVKDLEEEFHFKPQTPLKVGIQKFVDWYREYYGKS